MLIRNVNERLSLDGADKNQNKMDGILSNAQKGLDQIKKIITLMILKILLEEENKCLQVKH